MEGASRQGRPPTVWDWHPWALPLPRACQGPNAVPTSTNRSESASHLTPWPPKCHGIGLRPGPHIEKAGFGSFGNWLWKHLKPRVPTPSPQLLRESSTLRSPTRNQRWCLRTGGSFQGRNVPPAPLFLPLLCAQGRAGPAPGGDARAARGARRGAPEPEFCTHGASAAEVTPAWGDCRCPSSSQSKQLLL